MAIREKVKPEAGKIVDMSWDPITRIVGNLGIYTKIDFDNREVVSCKSDLLAVPRLQRVHEGQGPAGRALHHQPHLRHLRRQPRRLLVLRAADGLRRQAAAAGRVDRQPRRGGRVHLRPHHLPGQPGVRGLLRADGQGDQPERAGPRPRRPTPRGAAIHGYRTIARHHAVLQPVHGRDVPRGAAHEPHRAGDDLPDGGAPRAPLDDLPGRRRDAWPRRRCSPTTSAGCCAAWTSSRRPSP